MKLKIFPKTIKKRFFNFSIPKRFNSKQIEIEKIYESIIDNRPVKIKKVKNAGRGIFANQIFKATDTIHTEFPPIVVPSFSNYKKLCRTCLTNLVSFFIHFP